MGPGTPSRQVIENHRNQSRDDGRPQPEARSGGTMAASVTAGVGEIAVIEGLAPGAATLDRVARVSDEAVTAWLRGRIAAQLRDHTRRRAAALAGGDAQSRSPGHMRAGHAGARDGVVPAGLPG